MRIVVLGGGLSPERDVSRKSASLIANALLRKGHEVALVDLYDGIETDEDIMSLYRRPGCEEFAYDIPEQEPDLEALIAAHGGRRAWIGPRVIEICLTADSVFLGLHGGHGEDGQLQAVLDSHSIPYTGCNYLGCAIAMDKSISKALVAGAGIRTADWITATSEEITPEMVKREIGLPCVVKPIGCGSSCGVSIVKTEEELEQAVRYAAGYKQLILVEKFISGREITIAVLNGHALPIIEIKPHEGFYDYKNKYQSGLTDHICPADLGADTEAAGKVAEKVFEVLRMSSYGRIDFIYDEPNREFYFIEANNLPGMTGTSLVPEAAAAAGIAYDDLCERIAMSAGKTTV